jgi:hypothetical protein
VVRNEVTRVGVTRVGVEKATVQVVFVSSAHADANDPLLLRLRRDPHDTNAIGLWSADTRIQVGQSILDEVRKAVAAADYFLFVMSENTSKSNWSRSEFNLAYVSQLQKQDVKIIPLRIHDVPVPTELKDLETIDVFGDYDQAFARLVEIICPERGDLVAQVKIDRAGEGAPIIDVASAIDRKLIEYFACHSDELKSIDRRRFEEFVAELFRGFGYEVELTARTRDGGRDVIAIGGREIEGRYLIECKRPDAEHKVGVRAVRELYGVKTYESATKAILATTAFFTRDALLFFERRRWELEPRDFNGLLQWVHQYLEPIRRNAD